MSLKDILNFEKMRASFSKDDLACILGLGFDEKTLEFRNNTYSGNLLSSWEKTSGQFRGELDSTIVPLSVSDSVNEYALSRLSSKPEGESVNKSLYELVDVERNTFCIVINDGFVEGIKDPQTKLEFLSKILDVFYVYCKIEEVSGHPLFRTYLDLLEGTTLKA